MNRLKQMVAIYHDIKHGMVQDYHHGSLLVQQHGQHVIIHMVLHQLLEVQLLELNHKVMSPLVLLLVTHVLLTSHTQQMPPQYLHHH
jgi:hypothetical protein